ISLPSFKWSTLASHGTENTVASAAKNSDGKYKTQQIKADKGETFVAVLRYLAQALIKNANAIKKLLLSIDAISENSTIKAVVTELMNELASSDKDSVVTGVVDLLNQEATQIYWTFADYISPSGSFTYPDGLTAEDALGAVSTADDLVEAIIALLGGMGVTDSSTLSGLVSGLLYTNDMVTTIATAIYGALEGTSFGVTPKELAAYLTDTSYGTAFTKAAKALKSASSWADVTSLSWGFADGSQSGFIKALAALCRPVNDLLAAFLAEGSYDITGLLGNVIALLSDDIDTAELEKALAAVSVDIAGSNGYESAIIPILEAFMCSDVKTYSEYVSDYNKAKDNLIIDILTPLLGFVDDVLESPFDTVLSVLPNVAYFIDNYGVSQAVDNLLAPITKSLLGAVETAGFDIDKILETALGSDLGTLITEALGVNIDFSLEIGNLSKCNIQDLVLPLLNSLLSDYGISLPSFKWSTLASHGTEKTVASAAKNSDGKYTTIQITADKGETLIAVLRYLAQTITSNANAIKQLLCSISAIAGNSTIVQIITSVFNQLGTAGKDQIVGAVFYFLLQEPTNAFFDYTGFTYSEYEFTYPTTVDSEFLAVIGPMVDSLISGLLTDMLNTSLNSLIADNLYKDSVISSIAVGLYGAIEGVNISDSLNLAELLAMTDIDFTTGNVAALLVNSDYGATYSYNAEIIKNAGSWANVDKDSLIWGVTDRTSFLNALCAVLRPVYGVLDVLLNDGSLGLFSLIYLPGTDGYTSTIVPLMEALGLYNIKTQYEYRKDIEQQYDAILLDILNPLLDKVEDILSAPIQTIADMLPNLSLFFANDGLLQLIDNLLIPISALLDSIKPIVNVNDLLVAAGLDIDSAINSLGLGVDFHFDIYDLSGTLECLIGADNIVALLNAVLGIIEINGQPLGLELMDIDWYQLASHGTVLATTSQAATYGSRICVDADADEVLIAVLRYLVNTINYKDNFNTISTLISGLIGDADESITDVVNSVLGVLTEGDTDDVISALCELLQTLA
ncbi:MAG: hypothetical protein LUH82_03020, partial [Clostridiales bacterium]|nr:hypothetical protein [Clostridiales bacterium]